MDAERLAIVASLEERPYWAFAEIVYDYGPIAGVLFYDESPTNPVDDGAEPETAAAIIDAGLQHRGWVFWPVGEEAQTSSAEAPWSPLAYIFGSRISTPAALRRAVAMLEDRDPPTEDYAESAELVTAMLEVEDLEYLLVPDSSAIPTAGRA